VSKKRRARTRRQAQIRRQEQIRREAAGRRGETRASETRTEERRRQREAQLVPLMARLRLLTWLLILSLVCLAYAIGLWIVEQVARPTQPADYPGVWKGLRIGLGVAVGLCWIPGAVLTFRDRSWFWLVATLIPFTTIPAVFYYSFTRRRALRHAVADIREGKTVRAGPPRDRRQPDRRRKPSGRPAGGTPPSSTASVKLLGDR